MSARPVIFCAIDTPDLPRAIELAKSVGPVTRGLKLGLEFFCTFGPQGVEKIRNACPGAEIFLDLKFHDIPNTVASVVRSVSENIAPAYLNVHAQGGHEMMEAAKAACAKKTKLLAVTILTSVNQKTLVMYDDNLKKLSLEQQVFDLSVFAHESGLDGVVCSGYEIELIKSDNNFNKDFVFMVPGIRPEGSDKNDQKRVMTPKEAMSAGATHLVIGRPITGAPDPAAAARKILDTL
ncbi:MAG: orotidine-5'-phosphate decarboxylase [Alphaproteobacteria bacterium]|jgi:orotidine-5'-phosphate decarboxylase|nr:orotidine-5'-phosphate decarboxylase [Alphaproteobacteria bacterium]